MPSMCSAVRLFLAILLAGISLVSPVTVYAEAEQAQVQQQGQASAQTQGGTVRGRVVDADSGEPITTATVSVAGMASGFRTDRSGSFEITNVASGARQVQASVMGFRTEVRDVVVRAGEAVTVEFRLARAPLQLDEVVVRGTATISLLDVKDLLETPRAIQVLDGELLDRAGATGLAEALDLSASVARQNNFGGLWNSFSVRGFAGDENLPSNYLVNGFNAGRGFGGSRDLAGIESVVVLKGPTGALFGRGEPGGAVNLVTKRPTADRGGMLRSGLDHYGSVRLDADYRSGFLSDRLAVRVVGYNEAGESFRDAVESKGYGIFPSFLLQLSTQTSLVYELEASQKKVPFDRGVVAINGELGAVPPSRFLGEPGDGPMTAEVTGHQVELNHWVGSAWRLLLGMNHRATSLEGYSTEPELATNRQRLYQDGRTLSRQRRYRNYDAQYQVFRAELSGQFFTGAIRHQMILGVDTDRFDNDQVFRRYRPPVLGPSTTGAQSLAIDVFNPVYGQYPLPEPGPLTDRLEVLKATGFYLQDQIDLTSRLRVRLGLRYDEFSQQLDNRLSNRTTEQSGERISPQFGVVFRAKPTMSLYGSYGEGFRANSGSDFAGNAFDPNESQSFEGGINVELLNGSLRGNVALFQLTQRNMLVADPTNAGFSAAIGEARSRGAEVDLTGNFAGFDVHVSYAATDATSTKGVLDVNFGREIKPGDRLINVPRHSFSSVVSRDVSVLGRPLTLGSGTRFVGDRVGETGTSFELPSYTTVRAFSNLELGQRVTARFELDNLLNTTYYPNSFSTLWLQPGSPRRGRVSLQVQF